MAKLTIAITMVLAGLVGCTGTSSSTPAESPDDAEAEASDPEASEEDPGPAIDEVEQGATGSAAMEGADEGADAEKGEAAKEAEGKEGAGEKPPPGAAPKGECADLKEGDCKIRSGCAWSSDKKCVEQ